MEERTKPIHVAVDPVVPEGDEDAQRGGIDLVALGVSFLEQWRLALAVMVLVAGVGFAYVYSLKPQYVATATILPQQGRVSDPLVSLFSGGSGVGGLYTGLLRSRTVQDIVIQRAHLLEFYHVSDPEVARNVLAGTSTFAPTSDGLMTVSVRDGDASHAALIANTYLDALKQLNEDLGKQQSQRTMAFFKGQLEDERALLATAESSFQDLQRRTGLVEPSSQISSSISSIQGTDSQIKGLQVQRAALLESETPANPEVQALDARIAALRGQEQTQQTANITGGIGTAPSATRAVDLSIELQRAQRDVSFYSSQVSSLSNDYESARLNDVDRSSAFQVVDRAIPPEQKAWPPRRPYLAFSLALALLAAFFVVVLRLLAQRALAHAATLERLRRLRGALR